MTKIIDLRSDTATQPTHAMRAAMMAVPLGDDVFGDDPSVNALQDKIESAAGLQADLAHKPVGLPEGTDSLSHAALPSAIKAVVSNAAAGPTTDRHSNYMGPSIAPRMRPQST